MKSCWCYKALVTAAVHHCDVNYTQWLLNDAFLWGHDLLKKNVIGSKGHAMHYHHEGTTQRRDIFSPSHRFHSLLSSLRCGTFSKSVDRLNLKLPISRVMTNTSRRHVQMARDCEGFKKKLRKWGKTTKKKSQSWKDTVSDLKAKIIMKYWGQMVT